MADIYRERPATPIACSVDGGMFLRVRDCKTIINNTEHWTIVHVCGTV